MRKNKSVNRLVTLSDKSQIDGLTKYWCGNQERLGEVWEDPKDGGETTFRRSHGKTGSRLLRTERHGEFWKRPISRSELVQAEKEEKKKKICSCVSLKGMRLNVPRAVRAGHSVTLGCEYDLEGAPLYSVKWYRENDEFYRFVPKEAPPIRVFPIQGIRIDVSVSNEKNVTLLSVSREISGQYQCEVSADAPDFHTELLSTPMTVAVVPAGVPLVMVDKTGLEHGRPLIANCHAPPSHPAANITFFVNDEKVPGYTSEVITSTNDQLEEKTARLELTGVGGSWEPLRIRCESSLFRLYRAKSVEVEVRIDTPQPASVLLFGPNSKGSPTASRVDPFWITRELLSLLVLRIPIIWLNST